MPAATATDLQSSVTKPSVSIVTSFPTNPLTTTFTRPSDCEGLYASNFLTGIDFSTTCMPKGFHAVPTSYFSPGLVCPTGYYSACHDTVGVKSITTVTCCPSYASDVVLSCVTTSNLRSVWSTLFCTWIAPSGSGTQLPLTVSDNGITSTEARGFTSPGGLNAFGIRMVYQSSDLQTGTATTSATRTRQGVGATNTKEPDSSKSSGLSTGAKAAIGVVVPLAAIGLLVALFFWWRRRRQYKEVKVHPVSPPELQSHQVVPTSELSGRMLQPHQAVELPAQ